MFANLDCDHLICFRMEMQVTLDLFFEFSLSLYTGYIINLMTQDLKHFTYHFIIL